MRQNYFFEYVPNAYINLCVDKAQQLAKTHFKATLGETDQQLTVRLVIQPKMTTADWLNQLLKFVGGLADVVQNNNQAA